jgi:hypothetical protein
MARPRCDTSHVLTWAKENNVSIKGPKKSTKKEIYNHQIGVVTDLGFFIYGDICPNF